MEECNHEFVSYKQCCYCGAFENGRNEIVEERTQANVEDLRNSFNKWWMETKETNGGYPPLAMQVFFWFDKKIGIFDAISPKSASPNWTPITSEASLPKDDEALCLFVEWKDGILKERWVITAGQAKEEWPIIGYTHYTILQPPVK